MVMNQQYRRMAAVVVLLLVGFGWLAWRMFQIQVARHQELSAKASQFTHIIRPIEAWRGEIRDRRGIVRRLRGGLDERFLLAGEHRHRSEIVAVRQSGRVEDEGQPVATRRRRGAFHSERAGP